MKRLHLRTSDNNVEGHSPKIYGIKKKLHLRTSHNKDEDYRPILYGIKKKLRFAILCTN